MKFEEHLARNVRGFWAASYSFGLKLFDQYLLRRLAQNRLNAVVLIDHDKLADVWEQLDEREHYLARRVGRRYLLRGIQTPRGGAFHPKTYLLTQAETATLLVGSGNLSREGIDQGHEVFTSFSSASEQDLPSLRAWAGWMSRLVDRQADDLLRERWAAMRESCPWMIGSAEGSLFLVNEERTLLEQLGERLPAKVEELIVSAPFFDPDAQALRKLVAQCDPSHLTVYLGARASVNGPSLASVLRDATKATLKRFEPRTYVHAKLIGAIGGDGEGVLLCGSPNLSIAALDRAFTDSGGNCESAVLRKGDAAQVRTVFEGSGLQLIDQPFEDVEGLRFSEDHPSLRRPHVLRSARWRQDGRVSVDWAGKAALPNGAQLKWQEAVGGVALDEEGVSEAPLNELEPLPLVAWIVNEEGAPISNRTAIDDPRALQEELRGSERARGGRPPELKGVEAPPFVRLVLWAHEKFIFDPTETAAFKRAQEAAGEDQEAEDTTEFWERYAREELQYDPRTSSYKPLTPGSGAAGPVDELLRQLELLLHSSPAMPDRLLRVLTGGVEETGGEKEPRAGTPWTMEARLRVRAYNLLMRWCTAVADERQALISPAAPLLNYQTLLGVLLAAWLHEALDPKPLRRLLFVLLRSFIGARDGQGFLGRLQAQERDNAVARLHPLTIEAAAGLAAVAMHSGWRGDIYDWQPILRRAFEFEVIEAGQGSVAIVDRISGEQMASSEIDVLLRRRMQWVDDDTWCERLAEELDLEHVGLDLHRSARIRAAVDVTGINDPLHDGRLLTVARRTVEFKHLPAVLIIADGARIVFEPGNEARALVDGVDHHSARPVTAEDLQAVEQQGGSWADVLGLPAPAAAA